MQTIYKIDNDEVYDKINKCFESVSSILPKNLVNPKSFDTEKLLKSIWDGKSPDLKIEFGNEVELSEKMQFSLTTKYFDKGLEGEEIEINHVCVSPGNHRSIKCENNVCIMRDTFY